MHDLPARISDWLLVLVTSQRAVAYLAIDAAENLVSAGGDLAHYGLSDPAGLTGLTPGAAASQQLPFLEGLLPLPEDPFLLHAVGMPGGTVADVHFFVEDGITWVVLLDVTPEHDDTRKVQQKAYDMTLLSQREARLIAKLEAAHAELTRAHAELAESRDSLLRAHRRLQRELRDAESYIRAILPAPMSAPFGVDWRYVPSTELGGDSFGYHWIDSEHFALYLLDVCGHGVGPALLSVAVINALRSGGLPQTDFHRPEEVLSALNHAYQMEDHDGMYFTIWYGVYQPRTGKLRYASAGHPPPLLVSGASGTDGDVIPLTSGGLLLGLRQGTQYETEERTLVGPARLFLFSDGVYEIQRPDGSMLPFSAFQDVLTKPAMAERSELDSLLQFAQDVRGGPLLEDDFSIGTHERLTSQEILSGRRHSIAAHDGSTTPAALSAASSEICAVETAVISYRVADFLKKYPPFNTADETDLVALAANGKVRFFEPNEYVLWQGEPHKAQIFVIQQGTVSLWDDQREQAELRDVRGAGDMLGLERYNGARSALYSARTESDVVVYAFPQDDFDEFIHKYPHAAEYVAAEGGTTHNYQPVGTRPEFPKAFLLESARKPPLTCTADETVASAVGRLLAIRSDAIIVLGADHQAHGVLTRDSFLKWLTTPGSSPEAPVASLLGTTPVALAPDATIPDGVLAMIDADASALVITADGTPGGRVQALVTRRDLQPLFGEVPTDLVRLCRVAPDIPALRALNQRVRAFLLAHLSGPVGVAWLSRFASLVDEVILTRIIDIVAPGTDICWCICGAAGRRESLTMRAPRVLAVVSDTSSVDAAGAASQRVMDALVECGYVISGDPLFTPDFLTANAAEWTTRYRGWLADPVARDAHKARRLFDVRHVHGPQARWREVEAAAMNAVTPAFVHLMANDCLDSLPPLTFFKDAVVDAFGDQADTFRLEYSALRPLVDVGRVFGLAARAVFGHSTLERFATARVLLPEHDEIFREAADTFQLVLWQQARVGISTGTAGTELPASTLSRNDRQVLKGGFRSILRLLDFTANREWLARL